MNISIAITNFNRTKLLFDALANVLDDDRVSEIVISDDHSEQSIYNQVVEHYKGHPKVKIFRNEQNIDCYHNKAQALRLASNDWCCLLDSDNIYGRDYIDRIESLIQSGVTESTIYTPSWAQPHFNFIKVSGVNISRSNIGGLLLQDNDGKVQTMLNAANYFVHRQSWLSCFVAAINPVTSDSIFMAYRWLESGRSIYVVPDLNYQHRVNNHGTEEPSHYGKNINRTPSGFHNDILQRLKNMR